jgi:hypothetical protein
MPRPRVRTRTLVILLVAAVIAVLAGVATVTVAVAAPGWILAQLSGTGVAADAAAVGGATAALGYALLLLGAGLLGLALALRVGAGWARPAGTMVVGALLASLVGGLGATIASLVREPSFAVVYGAAAAAIGLGLLAFATVLLDLIRGAGTPD